MIRRCSGFSLIELVGMLSVLGLLLLIGGAMLVGTLQLRQAAAALQQRLAQRNALADQFRTDVAEASAAPEALDAEKASPTCLILGGKDGKHIVYRWNQGRLERSVSIGQKTTRSRLSLGRDVTAMEFDREGRVVVMRITEEWGKQKLQRQSVIKAALGGDLR